MTRQPQLTIFAGPNGSGKSTLKQQMTSALHVAHLGTYINADEIATEMFLEARKSDTSIVREKFERPAFSEAGRRRKQSVASGRSFSFETVFSHPSKLDLISQAKVAGYFRLFFVSTSSPMLNLRRVKKRVSDGGHPVPLNKIVNRYYRAMSHLGPACQMVDEGMVFDNSGSKLRPVAQFKNSTTGTTTCQLLRPTPFWVAAWEVELTDLVGQSLVKIA
jgi:predicted ABC-type ATPase